MDRVGNRLHVALEQAAGIGIGDHDACDIRAEPGLERFQIDAPVRIGGNVLHTVARKGGRGRIGPVGAFGHQDDFARIALGFQRGADAENAAQFAMRPRLGAHRDAVHAGELDQPMRQLVHDLERPAHGVDRLQRMHIGEARHPRDLFVEARIVLHRAAAEREEPEIDGVVLAA